MNEPIQTWPILPTQGRRWNCLALGEMMLRFGHLGAKLCLARA